jgi:uncharacterized membrane protein (UPF0127 family)
MKKFLYLFLLLAVPLLLGSLYSIGKNTVKRSDTTEYTIEGKKYQLLTARTPSEWEKGLMYVKKKEGFDGMMFVFPSSSLRTFWNMNTLVDLTIVWMQDDQIVGKTSLPSIEKSKSVVSVYSPVPVNKVVELIQ